MARHVVIFDTSVLCCLINIPGKDTAGSGTGKWDHETICKFIEKRKSSKSVFVLPLASIIETGNHIAQAKGDRFSMASKLAAMIFEAANASSPWAAFTDQADLWEADRNCSKTDGTQAQHAWSAIAN